MSINTPDHIPEQFESQIQSNIQDSSAQMFQEGILRNPEKVNKLIDAIHAKYQNDPFRDNLLTGIVTRQAEWFNDAFQGIQKNTSTMTARLQEEVGYKTQSAMQA